VTFACPGCGQAVDASPDRWGLRCPACRRVLRTRAVDASGPDRLYDVEVAGQPETRRRVAIPWTRDESRRLRRWLTWSTVLTLGLVVVLYALARWAG
jgi:tRNA(Ile2) C34 agmatinyltransferase TiaS